MPSHHLGRDNYEKLLTLVPNLLDITEYQKLTAPGFMDFNIDVLDIQPHSRIIAISHYYKHEPSGDMIPDPDMQLRVFPVERRVESLTYQDLYSYQQVKTEEGLRRDSLRQKLDGFLNVWLSNLLKQGHQPTPLKC